jgi:GNAT superfamily N-acetyltransferase
MRRTLRARTATVRRAHIEDAETLAWMGLVARAAYYSNEPMLTDSTPRPSQERVARWQRRVLAPPPALVLLAEVAGEPVGKLSIAATDDPQTVELKALHVLPHMWQRGIGSLLHDALVVHMRQVGARRAQTWVWDVNPRGRAFYERHGWVPDGRTRNVPNSWQFVGMTLQLPDAS